MWGEVQNKHKNSDTISVSFQIGKYISGVKKPDIEEISIFAELASGSIEMQVHFFQ